MARRTTIENPYDPEVAAFAKQDEIRATLALSSAHSSAAAVRIPTRPYGPWHDAVRNLLETGAVMRSGEGLFLAREDAFACDMAKAIALSRFLLGYRPLPEEGEGVLLNSTSEGQAAVALFLYFADSCTWIERALRLMGGRYDDDTPAMIGELEEKKIIVDLWERPSSPCHQLTPKGRAAVEAWLYSERGRVPFPFSNNRRRSPDPRHEPVAQSLRGRLPLELLGQHELEELTADYARRHLRLVDVHVVGSGSQEGKDVQGWSDANHSHAPVVLQAKSTDSRTLAKTTVTKELKNHGAKISSASRYYFVTNARLDAASQKLVAEAGTEHGVATTPVARAELEDFLTRPSNYDLIARYFPMLKLVQKTAGLAPRRNMSDTDRCLRTKELAQVAMNREWGREFVVKDLEGFALRGLEDPWGTTSWQKQFARAGDDALEVVVEGKIVFRLPYPNIVLFDEIHDTVYIVCPEQVRGLLDDEAEDY